MPAKASREKPIRRSLRTRQKETSPAATVEKPKGRKRKITASFDVSPTREKQLQKKSKDGREIDIYCWECHELGQDEVCSLCPRVYHRKCLGKSNKFSEEGACGECQLDSIDGGKLPPSLSCGTLKQLLSYAMDRVAKKKNSHTPKFLSWPLTSEDNSKLCNIIDLVILVDKMNHGVHYTKPVEFLSDVKWIYHNCHILYGADADLTIAAMGLIKDFKKELIEIEACSECYYNMHAEELSRQPSFFSRLCREPHVLVWAKMKGFPYWPAKCVRVANGIADVRFFGTHDKSHVPASKCYLMSLRYPTGKSPKQARYLNAMAEFTEYMVQHERKFGAFTYAPQQTSIPADLDDWLKNNHKRGTASIDISPNFIERKRDHNVINLSDIDSNPDMLQDASQDTGNEYELLQTSKDEYELLQTSKAVFTDTIGNIVSADDVQNAVISNVHSTSDFEPIESNSYNSVEDIDFTVIDQPNSKESSGPVSVCMTFSADDEGNNESSSFPNDASVITSFCAVSSSHNDTDNVFAKNSASDATDYTSVTKPIISDSTISQDFSVSNETNNGHAILNDFDSSCLPMPEDIGIRLNDTETANNGSIESKSILDLPSNLISEYVPFNLHYEGLLDQVGTITNSLDDLKSYVSCDVISLIGRKSENTNTSSNKGDPAISSQCSDIIEITNTPSVTTDVLEYIDDDLYICHSSNESRNRSTLSGVNNLLYRNPNRKAVRRAQRANRSDDLTGVVLPNDPFLIKALQECRLFLDLFIIRVWAIINRYVNAPEVILAQHTKLRTLQKRIESSLLEIRELKNQYQLLRKLAAAKRLPAIEASKTSDSDSDAAKKSGSGNELEKKNDSGNFPAEINDSHLQCSEKNISDIDLTEKSDHDFKSKGKYDCAQCNIKSVRKDDLSIESKEKCDSDVESGKKIDSLRESIQKSVEETFKEKYESYANEKIETFKLEQQKLIETNKADIEALHKENEILRSDKQNLEKDYQLLLIEFRQLTENKTSQGSQTILGLSEIMTNTEVEKIVQEQISKEKVNWELAKENEIINAMTADWCIVCTKPATIHCCLNTNYCSTNCQQKHMSRHSSTCKRLSQRDYPSTSGTMPNSFCSDSIGSQQVVQSSKFQTRSVTTIQVSNESVAANIISSQTVSNLYGVASLVENQVCEYDDAGGYYRTRDSSF